MLHFQKKIENETDVSIMAFINDRTQKNKPVFHEALQTNVYISQQQYS